MIGFQEGVVPVVSSDFGWNGVWAGVPYSVFEAESQSDGSDVVRGLFKRVRKTRRGERMEWLKSTNLRRDGLT